MLIHHNMPRISASEVNITPIRNCSSIDYHMSYKNMKNDKRLVEHHFNIYLCRLEARTFVVFYILIVCQNFLIRERNQTNQNSSRHHASAGLTSLNITFEILILLVVILALFKHYFIYE